MTKAIKIFSGTDAEAKANSFLKTCREVYDIKFTEGIFGDGITWYSIMVIYEDYGKNEMPSMP